MRTSRHVKQEDNQSAQSVETSCQEQDAQPRPSKMPPDKVCFGRSESNQAWKRKGFLGCVTEPEALTKCCTLVSDSYTITGYQGRDYDFKIELNGTFLLPVEPKVMGRLIGIDFDGLQVPFILSQCQKRGMLDFISEGKRPAVECLTSRGSVNMNTLRPDLRQYILKRAIEVFVAASRGLSPRYVYCMTRELLYREKYGWAECALEGVTATLRKQKQLTLSARSMLTIWFDAALPMPAEFKSAGRMGKVPEEASGQEGRESRLRTKYETKQRKRGMEEPEAVQIPTLRRSKRLKLVQQPSQRLKLVQQFAKVRSDLEASLLISVPASREIIRDTMQDSVKGRLVQDDGSCGVGDPEGMYVKAWRTVKKRLKDSLMRFLS